MTEIYFLSSPVKQGEVTNLQREAILVRPLIWHSFLVSVGLFPQIKNGKFRLVRNFGVLTELWK